MKKPSLMLVALLAAAGLGAFETELSPKARKVVDYLLADWAKHMHSTSIPLAMKNLGLEADDALRLEIGRHFRENPKLARNLEWWGANNYILSNEEKRIAKQIVNTFDAEEKLPTMDALVEELGIPRERLRDRLRFLKDAGLLVESTDSPLGYELVRRYGRWGGPLRYNFHTITIGEEDPFDVW